MPTTCPATNPSTSSPLSPPSLTDLAATVLCRHLFAQPSSRLCTRASDDQMMPDQQARWSPQAAVMHVVLLFSVFDSVRAVSSLDITTVAYGSVDSRSWSACLAGARMEFRLLDVWGEGDGGWAVHSAPPPCVLNAILERCHHLAGIIFRCAIRLPSYRKTVFVNIKVHAFARFLLGCHPSHADMQKHLCPHLQIKLYAM